MLMLCWSALVLFVVGWRVYHGVFKLRDDSLRCDLEALGTRFDLESMLRYEKWFFSIPDVITYYSRTTDRDYRLLELCMGPGLHTKLSRITQVSIVYSEAVSAKRVLEVGCGRGYCTRVLAGQLPLVRFDAVDMVSRHIEVSKRDCSLSNASYVHSEAARFLSKQPGVYDLIFGVESLCHTDKRTKMRVFMYRASRSLLPGGKLVIIDGFRSVGFRNTSLDAQTAMHLAEFGFRIRKMPTKDEWTREAEYQGLTKICDEDLTEQALPFWTLGWRVARVVLNLGLSTSLPRCTAANFLAIMTVAHALRGGAAEYGVLVFEKKRQSD